MYLIVKVILSELASADLLPAEAKTQFFIHLCSNSTLQLINGISSDLQNYLDTLITQWLLYYLRSHFIHTQFCFLIS